MLPKNFTSNKPRTIVVSLITLVIGVLFCCSPAFGDGLKWLIGGSLCFAGILYIINSIVSKRSLFTMDGIVGVFGIAFGIIIMFVIKISLVSLLSQVVPWLMIAIGVAVFAESFLAKFSRYSGAILFVILLVAGIAFIALGICLACIKSWQGASPIVFGGILIVFSLYTLISLFIKRNND